jgi:M6 family metalloprotease-like protein
LEFDIVDLYIHQGESFVKKSLLYVFSIVWVLSACTTETLTPEVPAADVTTPEVVEPEVVVPEVVAPIVRVFDPSRRLLGQDLLVPAMNVCKLPDQAGQPDVVIGFPMKAERIPRGGDVNAMVFYVDFSNYRLNWTTNQMNAHFEPYGSSATNYYGLMSESRLTMQFDVFPEVVSLTGTLESYRLGSSEVEDRMFDMMFETIELVDDRVDFSAVDFLVFVINPNVPYELADRTPAFPTATDFPYVTDERNLYNATILGLNAEDWLVPGLVLTHEIGHLIGLADLYDYDFQEDYDQYHRFVGGFDIMGFLDGRFLELLEWHRYLLGWLDDTDVACIPAETLRELEVNIGNQSLPNTQAMLVVPFGPTQALVVEPKLQGEYCNRCFGVLVYTVDSSIPSGAGPVRIYPRSGSRDPYFYDGLIKVGDELQVAGFLIRVIESYDESFVVNITKSN